MGTSQGSGGPLEQSNLLKTILFCVVYSLGTAFVHVVKMDFVCDRMNEDNPMTMTGRACSRLSGPEDDNLSGHRSFINSIQCQCTQGEEIYDPQIY